MQPATILEQIASQGSKSIIPLIVSSGMARDKVHRIGRADSVERKLRDAGAAAFRFKKKTNHRYSFCCIHEYANARLKHFLHHYTMCSAFYDYNPVHRGLLNLVVASIVVNNVLQDSRHGFTRPCTWQQSWYHVVEMMAMWPLLSTTSPFIMIVSRKERVPPTWSAPTTCATRCLRTSVLSKCSQQGMACLSCDLWLR